VHVAAAMQYFSGVCCGEFYPAGDCSSFAISFVSFVSVRMDMLLDEKKPEA